MNRRYTGKAKRRTRNRTMALIAASVIMLGVLALQGYHAHIQLTSTCL
jgi:ABC-type lipoprotein release transport system permease subunit